MLEESSETTTLTGAPIMLEDCPTIASTPGMVSTNWLTYWLNSPKGEPFSFEGSDVSFYPDFDQAAKCFKRESVYAIGEGCQDEEDWDTIDPPYGEWEHVERKELPHLWGGAPPLEVLKRILITGYLKASWSFQAGRPTVYGHRAACSFTDLPLHALVGSQSLQGGSQFWQGYGIAVDASELFAAGARRTIKASSMLPTDTRAGWTRVLDDSCGVSLSEQYRYVAVEEDRSGGYSESEWRWPFDKNKSICPGLPILLDNPYYEFSSILVFVPTRKEAEAVLDQLKLMHDSEYIWEFADWYYHKERLRNVRVLSLEEAKCDIGEKGWDTVRLDDFSLNSLSGFVRPEPTQDTIERVKIAISEARRAALKACVDFGKSYESRGYQPYGNAFLLCKSPQSEFLSAVEELADELGLSITATVDRRFLGHQIGGVVPSGASATHSVQESYFVMQAVERILKRHFPDVRFWVTEYLT